MKASANTAHLSIWTVVLTEFAQLLSRHALFVLVAGVVMIPTFLTRAIVYGGPFETGYISIRDFLWRSPAFFEVLFASEHGLVSWTPLLGVAIIGLILFAFRLPKIGVPFLTALVAFYIFMCLYPDWAGISSYGNRFFVSVTPLFILGLAYLLERVAAHFRQPRAALAATSAVLAVFVLWNLGMIYQWGVHLIPARGPISFREATYNQFHVVPRAIDVKPALLFSAPQRHDAPNREERCRAVEQKCETLAFAII